MGDQERAARCETCRFWGMDSYCQRYPKWHRVNPTHWCGEWDPTPEEAKRLRSEHLKNVRFGPHTRPGDRR